MVLDIKSALKDNKRFKFEMVAVTYESQDFGHKLSSFENEYKRY